MDDLDWLISTTPNMWNAGRSNATTAIITGSIDPGTSTWKSFGGSSIMTRLASKSKPLVAPAIQSQSQNEINENENPNQPSSSCNSCNKTLKTTKSDPFDTYRASFNCGGNGSGSKFGWVRIR